MLYLRSPVEDTEMQDISMFSSSTYLKLQVRTQSYKYVLKLPSTYLKLYVRT